MLDRVRADRRMMYLTAMLAGSLAAAPNGYGATRVALLETGGYWRTHLTCMPPIATDGASSAPLDTLTGRTPLPPKDWAQADAQRWRGRFHDQRRSADSVQPVVSVNRLAGRRVQDVCAGGGGDGEREIGATLL